MGTKLRQTTGTRQMKKLIAAIAIIVSDTDNEERDRDDWAAIASLIEDGIEPVLCFDSMDTCSRDLITPAAKVDPEVKAQASKYLGINWLF